MIELFYRRTRKLLVIALATVWLVCLACADSAAASTLHFERPHMPCCPRSGNQSARCSSAQCGSQAFQKSDARSAGEAPAAHPIAAPRLAVARPWLSSLRELTPGLFHRAAVFRLKDDLRI